MPTTQQLNDLAYQVRRDILRMVHKVNSGHPAGSLGCTEFFIALYNEIMDYSTDFTMDAAYLSIQFIYTDATQGWVMS